MQRAIRLAAPAGRANRIVDIGFRHKGLPGFLFDAGSEASPGIVIRIGRLGGSAAPRAGMAASQNASIGIAIVTSAPGGDASEARDVSGIRRSM